jgi:small subunit ribosomal protein S16
MVKIRLRRVGAKKQPHYRVVVTDSHSPRDGKFIETIGSYNPRTDPPAVEVDVERALYWLGVGAQPSAAVQRILDKMGIMSQIAAVRRGEVPAEALAEQIQAAEAKAKVEPVEVEEGPEESPEVEAEAFEAEGEAFDEEAEPAEEEDWSESDEAEDIDLEADFDLEDEDADDVDEE